MASMSVSTNRKGEPRYRVRVRIKGVYASKTGRNKREVERWARKTEDRADLNTMTPETQATVRTVAEMIDRYCKQVLPYKALNTQFSQQGQLMFWKSEIGGMSLADATTPVIAKRKALLAPRGNATINCYLAALQHCFAMAIKEWQWCEINPVRDVWRLPQPAARVRMLSAAERSRLMFYCRMAPCSLLETIVVVALSTGPRKSEVRNIKIEDYNHVTGRVVLDQTKNGDRRTVRLFGEARKRMAALYEARKPGQVYFFPSPRDPSRPVDFRYSWEMSLESAEIPNFCFHDLRHSAASYLAEQGATLADIKEILGHKTIQTTQKYTHLTESHTAALVQKMNLSIF
ncbi:site-specific integrase [Oryzomonas japonica]|uniref:Site-specific integrase n=1 Tax=Oryzomonas japonica TaxID=2603858 RepID=A0A7J4ZSE6_9BACT|nr:site-specific integrase [Oryzomonas japonica]KAB0665639.1 site-specific integrase [Oryzomonas japonica]